MVAKFKKGDRVTVLSGKDKGKTGEVLKVLPSKIRAVVQGINLYKRHTPPSQAGPGGIVEKEASIHLSNLSHLDPSDNKPARIGIKILDGGRRVRYAKRSGEIIDL
jgi:large subunit ribosomal protein L24